MRSMILQSVVAQTSRAIRAALSVLLLTGFLLFVAGCLATGGGDEPLAMPGPRPVLMMEYFPYPLWTEAQEVKGVTPLPIYSGWPRTRMERDMERLEEAGIDVLVLSLNPQDLAQENVQQQLHNFYDLLEAKQAKLRVVLCFRTDAPLAMQVPNVLGFLQKQGLLHHAHAWTWNGRTPVWFSWELHLDGENPYRDVAVMQYGQEIPLPLSPTSPGTCSNLRNGFQWLRAAESGQGVAFATDVQLHDGWLVPRAQGQNLRSGLHQALESHAEHIIISSWNNYRQGSFVEPNSLDRFTMLEILGSLK